MTETTIFGIHPVLEALHSDVPLERVYISARRKGKALGEILHLTKSRNVDVRFEPWERLTTRTGKNASHQGVVAILATYDYVDFNALLSDVLRVSELPFLLLLDQIQDPHNLGAILRSAECAGVQGVILTKHKASGITPTAVKVAAGATSYLPVCRVTNLANTIDDLKKAGIWIVGTSEKATQTYTEVDYAMPVALVIGNEEKGLRRLVTEKCDLLVSIPLHGKISSLNASVATGILLFEICRQREAKQEEIAH